MERLKKIAALVLFVVAMLLLYHILDTFQTIDQYVYLGYEGEYELYYMESTFWGLKTEEYELKFFNESDDYAEGWHINKDGEWIILIMYE